MQKNIKETLRRHAFSFSHSLGQNFLLDRHILEQIAEISELNKDSCVLEIGAGAGTLTASLAKRAKHVVALEVDRALIPVLNETLEEYDNVSILNLDVMKTDIAQLAQEQFGKGVRFSVVANLPYYITSPVLIRLLEPSLPVDKIVVMVQKEVAQRICASPGGKEYGALSIAAQYYMSAQIAMHVPADQFFPPPKVDSALVLLQRRETPPVNVKCEKEFFRTVRACFAMRRKTLANNLCTGYGLSKQEALEIIDQLGWKQTVRTEELSMQDLASLSNLLGERSEI